MPAERRSTGVALLEALVALVLLASTGVVLMQWLQQGLQTLARLEQKERDLADREWAMAILQTRPLLQEPSGQIQRETLLLRWSTLKSTAPRANGTPGGVDGPWQVSLVELQVDLQRQGQPGQRFPLRLIAQRRQMVTPPASGL